MRNLLEHQNSGHADDLFESSPFKRSAAAARDAAAATAASKGRPARRRTRASSRSAVPLLSGAGVQRAGTPPSGDGSEASSPDTPGLLSKPIRHDVVDAYIGKTLKERQHGKASRPARKSGTGKGGENVGRGHGKRKREKPVDDALSGKTMLVFDKDNTNSGEEDGDGDEDYYFSDD
eukprot:gene29211-9495_t